MTIERLKKNKSDTLKNLIAGKAGIAKTEYFQSSNSSNIQKTVWKLINSQAEKNKSIILVKNKFLFE